MKKKISNKQYAQALFEAMGDLKGEKLSEVIKRFVLLLACRHKLKRAEQIIFEYEKCVKRENGGVEIVVKTASKLEKILLNKIEKVFGDEVETKEELDENLLGGVVIKTEDRILDGSLKKQLHLLRQSLG